MSKSTWLVLGAVVICGVLAFVKLAGSDGEPTDEAAKAGDPKADATKPESDKKKALRRNAPAKGKPSPASAKQEARAAKLLEGMAKAQAAGDKTKASALYKTLRAEAWDTLAARRYALRAGYNLAGDVEQSRDRRKRIEGMDRARRLLSRAVYLPEMFTPSGASTPERDKLIAKIQTFNRKVMTFPGGVEGVTAPFEIKPGMRPVEVVARPNIVTPDPLRIGPNAILYWNQGNVRHAGLQAGKTYMLPLEELSVRVYQNLFRAGIFIGDWFVKEFKVGVGRPETPTPSGVFQVHSKEQNPDWWAPNGKFIKYGDPKNELGSRWIKIFSDDVPVTAGIGVHGTNAPKTVGTRCSNGCVRLANEDVNELYWWIRTGNGGGRATRIYID